MTLEASRNIPTFRATASLSKKNTFTGVFCYNQHMNKFTYFIDRYTKWTWFVLPIATKRLVSRRGGYFSNRHLNKVFELYKAKR